MTALLYNNFLITMTLKIFGMEMKLVSFGKWNLLEFWHMALYISGHKKEKSRVTIFCATNATGTEKMALTFIHKYKTPRPMKNLNYNNLPVHYFWNKKSWMQVSIFNEVLLKLNEQMKQKRRNIVLLLDN